MGSDWYYYANDGTMYAGRWLSYGRIWYYFAADGKMVANDFVASGKWYYFNASGAMQMGWRTLDGKTYFFKGNGAMASREWCQGYYLNANGTWTYKPKASWVKEDGGWKYQDTSGWFAKNETVTIDGKQYTFDADGHWNG